MFFCFQTVNIGLENLWGMIKVEIYRLPSKETFEELENNTKQYIEFYNRKPTMLKWG